MSMTEAEMLLSYVEVIRGRNAGRIHRIANGEWVTLIQHAGGVYFLWRAADWVAVCQSYEDLARKSRKKESVAV